MNKFYVSSIVLLTVMTGVLQGAAGDRRLGAKRPYTGAVTPVNLKRVLAATSSDNTFDGNLDEAIDRLKLRRERVLDRMECEKLEYSLEDSAENSFEDSSESIEWSLTPRAENKTKKRSDVPVLRLDLIGNHDQQQPLQAIENVTPFVAQADDQADIAPLTQANLKQHEKAIQQAREAKLQAEREQAARAKAKEIAVAKMHFWQAACANNIPAVRAELALKRFDVDSATKKDGMTALGYAATWGFKDMMAVLTCAGADLNKTLYVVVGKSNDGKKKVVETTALQLFFDRCPDIQGNEAAGN